MVSLLVEKEAVTPMTSPNMQYRPVSTMNSTVQLPRRVPLASPTHMQLRFWGTRGSIPVSGPGYLRYGGNTSCVSLTSDSGHLFIFDCGSGARNLGNYLQSSDWAALNPSETTNAPGNVKGYILLSHTHWDHIQGFPFFGPVFSPGTHFNIIGWNNYSQSLSDILAGQMTQHYFPVSFYSLPSRLDFYSICDPQTEATLDGVKITCHVLNHPLPSLAYRLELGDKTLVYATDHEPHQLPDLANNGLMDYDVIDRQLVELASGADVLIHDAQYSAAELPGKVGWGHSSVEVAVDTAIRAGVKQLVLFHHDPNHDDDAIDGLLATARLRAAGQGHADLLIVAASDGLNLEL